MAQVHSSAQTLPPATPSSKRPFRGPVLSPPRGLAPLQLPSAYQSGHLNLGTFSPVNQTGSFEFDRVIKRSKVHRRVKKKGAWKPSWKAAYLVLRPNLLSIYQNEDETGLGASITLSEVTAVAAVKKAHTENVFGVFSPSKNYHLQGQSARDTADWIHLIRTEAQTNDPDELDLPAPQLNGPNAITDHHAYDTTDISAEEDGEPPGSPNMPQWSVGGSKSHTRSQSKPTRRRSSTMQEYSGNEFMTSHSDFSDTLSGSLSKNMSSSLPNSSMLTPIASGQNLRPALTIRNTSQLSGFDASQAADPERVIRQGWLQTLKTSRGMNVRKWRLYWVVLRPRNISFYKNEQEYSTVKLLPMSSVINAAEIDPISRTKRFCLQIIVEDKAYRLCAPDDDELAKWLGALKSVLAKRQEAAKQVADGVAHLGLR